MAGHQKIIDTLHIQNHKDSRCKPLLPKPESGSVQQMNGYIVHVYLLYHHLEHVFIKQFNTIGQYEGYRS